MEKTCPKCGYQRTFCQCGRKKNTSGDPVNFQNYEDYTNTNFQQTDYSRTSRMRQNQADAKMKFAQTIMPINKESISTWISRTEIHIKELKDYSWAQHIYATSKGQWACHRSNMHCFICTLMQTLQMLRMMAELLEHDPNFSDFHWEVNEHENGSYTYNIGKITPLL